MDNPFDVAPELDMLTDLTGAPTGFTENMFFQAADSEGVGFWLHLATAPTDPGLWRSLLAIYLPGDELLVGRCFGRALDRRGPATGTVRIRCEEEQRRWTIEVDGALERTTRTRAGSGLVGSGVAHPVSMSVELIATSPVYDLFAAVGVPEQDWGGTHHEQAFTVTGSIRWAGGEIPIDAKGYRDHSSGSRDLSGLRGNNLVWGTFDDGQVFGHVDLMVPDGGHQISQAYVSDGTGIVLAKNGTEIDLTDTIGAPYHGRLELTAEHGLLAFEWTVLASATVSTVGPNSWVLGTELEDPDPLILVECPVRLRRADGCTGAGHLERTRRRDALELPVQAG